MTSSTEVATTISNQIPRWLKMALGYRDPVATETGLRFRCRAGCSLLVDIDLHEGWDLYNVTVRTNRKPNYNVRYEANLVDVETMVDILDRLDRGRLLVAS